MGEDNIINVTVPKMMHMVFNFFAKKLHATKKKAANINIQGNSGTAIPAYHASLLGTGKKLTSESIKRTRMRMKRTIIIFKIYE